MLLYIFLISIGASPFLLKGTENMNFSTFDKTEIKKYADEAKQKWGCTDAYKEYIQKHYRFCIKV